MELKDQLLEVKLEMHGMVRKCRQFKMVFRPWLFVALTCKGHQMSVNFGEDDEHEIQTNLFCCTLFSRYPYCISIGGMQNRLLSLSQ